MANNLMFVLIFVVCSRSNALTHETLSKKLEIFPPIEKSRFIQISQLEQILISIEETYKTMNEKQKQDAISISQATSELQLINQRLQNIENQIHQIEQTESFNKHRLELFQDSYMKEEIQFDDLKRKFEKNQQQTNNRLSEIDSSLDKIHTMQDLLLREIRKVNAIQTKLVTGIEEIGENSKPDTNKLLQNINTSQQLFQQEVKDFIKNSTNLRDTRTVLKIPESLDKNISSPQHTQNDVTISDLLISISTINDKFNNLQEQTKSVHSSVNKCISLGDDIYNDIQLQKQDVRNLLTDTQENLVNEIKQRSIEDTEQLGMTLKVNFDIILREQETFKNNCHRIQLHEERLEDKAVYALEKLFTYIENKTDGIRTELDRLIQNELKQNTHQTKEIQKLTEIVNIQKNSLPIYVMKKLTSSTPSNEVIKSSKMNKNITTKTTPNDSEDESAEDKSSDYI